jgi:hypothetical protein
MNDVVIDGDQTKHGVESIRNVLEEMIYDISSWVFGACDDGRNVGCGYTTLLMIPGTIEKRKTNRDTTALMVFLYRDSLKRPHATT